MLTSDNASEIRFTCRVRQAKPPNDRGLCMPLKAFDRGEGGREGGRTRFCTEGVTERGCDRWQFCSCAGIAERERETTGTIVVGGEKERPLRIKKSKQKSMESQSEIWTEAEMVDKGRAIRLGYLMVDITLQESRRFTSFVRRQGLRHDERRSPPL